MKTLAPAGLTVALDQDVVLRRGGRTLVGGTPLRRVRLTATGANHVLHWAQGTPLPQSAAARELATRLLDEGLLVARPRPHTVPANAVEAVVPARDRVLGLERCIEALSRTCPVLVVDDGSADAKAVRASAERWGARVLRLDGNRGPAAARNAGFAATSAPFVAFVDSDVVVTHGWLDGLTPHMADPRVAIAAPRVRALDEARRGLAGYETRRSSLDMGPRPGHAAPGRPVPYVPSTALLVRRDGFEGFDERLRAGEDVDLCWRTVAAGRRVVYEPRSEVRHEHRTDPGAWAGTRWSYALTVAPLARRHPAALPSFRAHLLAALAIGAAPSSLPLASVFLVGRGYQLHRSLAEPWLTSVLLAREVEATASGLARATRRTYAPALALGLRHRHVRRWLLAAFAVGVVERNRPALRDAPLSMVDDLIAATATWVACAREPTTRPLRPQLTLGRFPWRPAAPRFSSREIRNARPVRGAEGRPRRRAPRPRWARSARRAPAA